MHFSLVFGVSIFFGFLCWKTLKNVPSERWKLFFLKLVIWGIKNSRILFWFKKCQLTLVTKCPPKKLNYKMKKMGLSKIRKQFFNLTFLGGILLLRQVFFLSSIQFLIFWYPFMTYFKKKKFTSQKGWF